MDRLCDMFDVTLTDLDGIEENVTFKLPRELVGAEESGRVTIREGNARRLLKLDSTACV